MRKYTSHLSVWSCPVKLYFTCSKEHATYGLNHRYLILKVNDEKQIVVANISSKFLYFNNLNYEWKIAEMLFDATWFYTAEHVPIFNLP